MGSVAGVTVLPEAYHMLGSELPNEPDDDGFTGSPAPHRGTPPATMPTVVQPLCELERHAARWIAQLQLVGDRLINPFLLSEGHTNDTARIVRRRVVTTRRGSGGATMVVETFPPTAECRWWMRQATNLQGVVQRTQQPDCQAMLRQLSERRSVYAERLEQCVAEIAAKSRPVLETAAWLAPLLPHFQALGEIASIARGTGPAATSGPRFAAHQTEPFDELQERGTLVVLMHLMRRLWEGRPQYATVANISRLLAGLCDVFLERAADYGSFDMYFGSDPHELAHRLEAVFRTAAELKSQYFEFRDWCMTRSPTPLTPEAAERGRSHPGDATGTWGDPTAPREEDDEVKTAARTGQFPSQLVFARLDCFLERCVDIRTSVEQRKLFDYLKTVDLESDDVLRQAVLHSHTELLAALNDLSARGLMGLADVESPVFDQCMETLRRTALTIEQRTVDALVVAVNGAPVSTGLIKLVDSFARAMCKPHLAAAWARVFDAVWAAWHVELNLVHTIFRESRARWQALVGEETPGNSRLVAEETRRVETPPLLDAGLLPPLAAAVELVGALVRRLADIYRPIKSLAAFIAETRRHDEPTVDNASSAATASHPAFALFEHLVGSLVRAIRHRFSVWSDAVVDIHHRNRESLLEPRHGAPPAGRTSTGASDVLTVRLQRVVVESARDAARMAGVIEALPMDLYRHSAARGEPLPIMPPALQQIVAGSDELYLRYVHLSDAVTQYNRAKARILPHQQPLFEEELLRAHQTFQPGLDDLTWASGGAIDVYAMSCLEVATQLDHSLSTLASVSETMESNVGQLQHSLFFPVRSSSGHSLAVPRNGGGDHTLTADELRDAVERMQRFMRTHVASLAVTLGEASTTSNDALNDMKDRAGLHESRHRILPGRTTSAQWRPRSFAPSMNSSPPSFRVSSISSKGCQRRPRTTTGQATAARAP